MISLLQEIDLLKTGLLTPLINDYVRTESNIAHLFKYPFSIESFEQIIKDKSSEKTDRQLLIEALTSQYSSISTTEKVMGNIAALNDANTFTVTASHQPCLFLGPLYNIYKISAAINLANKLSKQYPQYRFVPVFWLGSEDHDIAELNNTHISGKPVIWTEAGTGAIGRLKTDSLQSLIANIKQIGVKDELVTVIEAGIKTHPTFGSFTQFLVNELFKEHGLVVLDQDDARLKKQFASIVKDEILDRRATSILQPNIDFLDANYKAQAKPREINFFYLGEGFRERIMFNASSGKYEINNKSISFTQDEIIAEIEAHPERFSPNVIFRPLYQELVLPNLAFVGGAGELSYWLELKPLFEHYGINYPMQVLRPSATIISNGALRKLEKLNLTVADFFEDIEQLINRYTKGNSDADGQLENEKVQIGQLFDTLAEKAALADPTLKQNVAAEKQKALSTIDNIASKMFKAEKRRQETAINQIRAIHAELYPENTLQERHESFLPFYDADFINTIVQNSDVFSKSFRVFLNA